MNANDGFIVPLAWPQTPAIKEGKWYDHPMTWIGVVKDGYYPVGHAAMLLIHASSGEVHYMDFGRYHTPIKQGRVRDKFTDPDVTVKTRAIIEGGSITNMEEIMLELSKNKATHGKGKLYAGIKYINNFDLAWRKAKDIQGKGAIDYGPFAPNGTNCSRFVAQVAKASPIGITKKALLKFPYTCSPSPFSNVKIINDFGYYLELEDGQLTKKNNRLNFLKRSN